MEPIMKYAELEEQEGDDQRYDYTDRYHFHRQILLRTYSITLHSVSFSFQLVRRQATAPLMIPQELMMPITPAVAIPPIPMWRA